MTEGQDVTFRIGQHETTGIVSMVSADRVRMLVDVTPEGWTSEPVWEVVYFDEVVRWSK